MSFRTPTHGKEEKTVVLAGNPNVGKSTVFNALTGLRQHTGNWTGKTVAGATGQFCSAQYRYTLTDIPGTYSLIAHSAEEEVARQILCFSAPDGIVVVCDATCLERNLNLVLQILEITDHVVVCVNLMDEARRKHIRVDTAALSQRLGVPVIPTVAQNKKSLKNLTAALDTLAAAPKRDSRVRVQYPVAVEAAIEALQPWIERANPTAISSRFIALKLLDADPAFGWKLLTQNGGEDDAALRQAVNTARDALKEQGYTDDALKDAVASALVGTAETLCNGVVQSDEQCHRIDRRLDRVFTGRVTAYPVMLLLLLLVFWLTIEGANYPSQLLSAGFSWIQERLSEWFMLWGAPARLHGVLIDGVFRVLSWVVAVMLPPMAIFFPLFTLLEDAGYLPRIAYNLDRPFQRCCACGKQALTMCMGFGCNAVGVTGCRIIDSPRERLLAVLTNSFVPCNGRFPTLLTLIMLFFALPNEGVLSSLLSAGLLLCLVVLGVLMTFAVTRLLSHTLLRGVPSSFVLELPPYRRPQFGKVLVRSVLDRTLFVLGRAAMTAAPAGLILWLAANITVQDVSLLHHAAAFLDPFARLLGLDGVILIAFILGFPANEIVLPIILMAYTANGTLTEVGDLSVIGSILTQNGWTWVTALCTMLFSLMHWPCSTTLLTIKKETGSLKWTALAAIIPTVCGVLLCFTVATIARMAGVV